MILPTLAAPVFAILAGLSGLASCLEQPRINIDVTLKEEEPVYIRNRTAKEIGRLKALEPPRADGRKRRTLGLTQGSMSYSYETQFTQVIQPAGHSACFAVKAATLAIIYKPTIYIASDYKSSGCGIGIIVAHEERHAEADVDVATAFLPALKKQLGAAARSIGVRGPFPQRMLEDEKQKVAQDIHSKMDAVEEDLLQERIKSHAVFDTDANYAQEMRPCLGKKR